MKIYKKDVHLLSEEEYALLRKDSFGASEVSVLMGVGFNTLDELIAQKKVKKLTKEELELGKKPNVRKGKELEDFILEKYKKAYNIKVIGKPTNMYEIWEGLTVNYDAIQNETTPVEIKYVSTFGHKYYDTSGNYKEFKPNFTPSGDMVAYLTQMAGLAGIPVYYYTQLQTQMIGLDADVGILVALFEKDWELRVYVVHRDPHFKVALKVAHARAWERMKNGQVGQSV